VIKIFTANSEKFLPDLAANQLKCQYADRNLLSFVT